MPPPNFLDARLRGHDHGGVVFAATNDRCYQGPMTDWIATYRLQFRPEFGFADAAAIVPYLDALGISHIYASPIFSARPGSPHGYDGLDPNRLNPELGTPADWDFLTRRRQALGMGWLQDIVPNHMAFHGANGLLTDILEQGRFSRYRDFFDIDWHHPDDNLQGRVMAPFLGTRYQEVLQNGDIRIVFSADGFAVQIYGALIFPLAIATYRQLLDKVAGEASRTEADPNVARLEDVLDVLVRLDDLEDGDTRRRQTQEVKAMLWSLYEHEPGVRHLIDSGLTRLNGTPGDSESLQALDHFLSRQRFFLCWWQRANRTINYRRFFNINELIALRQEDPAVFAHTHELIGALTADGFVDGVRIDHVDGLADPAGYLEALRRRLGEDALILVEKILAPDETLPAGWPVQGTTGYDFTHWVNALYVQRENEAQLTDIYQAYTGRQSSFEGEVRQAKREILASRLAGDLTNLVRRVQAAAVAIDIEGAPTAPQLRQALTEILVQLPVYRTYLDSGDGRKADRDIVDAAAVRALDEQTHLRGAIAFIQKLLLGEEPAGPDDASGRIRRLAGVRAFQQLSAALMAKGGEDTAFYRYHRLVSLNEVGGEPERFGCRRSEFHTFLSRRAAAWPLAMNSTATHDSKRGEDLRARLNVLSEIPDVWRRRLRRWHDLTRNFRTRVDGEMLPDRNTVYLLFQTLLGAWPPKDCDNTSFEERIQAYMQKALREAGQATSWIAPREAFETALRRFVAALLDPAPDNLFRADFVPFCRQIAWYGYWNALSQCLIKIAAPGVPDFYQGSEFWQPALVDPDNRRAVAYPAREHALKTINLPRDDRALVDELCETAEDGRIKLFLIARGLAARQRHPEVFLTGRYRPLEVEGALARHVVAFAREAGGRWAAVLVPRFMTALVKENEAPLGHRVWQDTAVRLPSEAPSIWRDVFTHQTRQGAGALAVGEILSHFPAALMISEEVL
jgi:(1->4)-alpha-D-glucan 1-alpha-D-glucosylmutase